MSQDWDALNQATIDHLSAGDYDGAKASAEEAVKLARERGERENLSVGLNNLGAVAATMGDLGAAEAAFTEAHGLCAELYGAEDEKTVEAAGALGELYLHQAEQRSMAGDLDGAGDALRKCVRLYETAVGPGHPAFGDVLGRLADNYAARGGAEAAIGLGEQSLDILRQSLKKHDPVLAERQAKTARLYMQAGQMDKAAALLQKAVKAYERAGEKKYGAALGQARNDLGECYLEQGRAEEARPLLESALKTRESALGAEHPAVAQSLNDLSVLMESGGDFTGAEPLARRALEIRRKAFGEKHVAVTQSLENLASICHQLGRAQEAEELLRESVAIWEANAGENHPATAQALFALSTVLFSRAKYRETERTLRRVEKIMTDSLGPENGELAMVYKALGAVCEKLGNDAEATRYAMLFGKLLQNNAPPPVSAGKSGGAG